MKPSRYKGVKLEILDRMCRGKNRYPDIITVCAAGAHYIEIEQITDLWWYKCPHCGGFHLTSHDRGKKHHVKFGL